MTRQTIRVLAAPTASAQTKGMVNRGMDAVLADVDTASLKANLERMGDEVAALFDGVQQKQGFRLKQFEVGIEISAEGGVNLIGTIKAGTKAAIKLTFDRA